MISFFLVRDILFRFISCNQVFAAPIGRIRPFFVNTVRRDHDLSYSNFLAAEDFFWRVKQKKSVSGFFRAQRLCFIVFSLPQTWKYECFCTNRWDTI